MDLTELREKINKLGADLVAITKKAEEEKRDVTDEEAQKFDVIDADREKLLAEERRQIRVREIEAPQGRRTEPQLEARGTTQKSDARPVDAMEGIRGWMLSTAQQNVSDEQRNAAKRLGFALGAKKIDIKLYAQEPLQTRRYDGVRDWENRALSTLNAGSPVDGYYTVQNGMLRPLEEALLAFGGMRSRATVLRTDTGGTLLIPTDNDTANKGEIIDENTAINEKDVAFGQVSLGAFKYSSKMIRVSVELLQDASFPIGPYLGRKLGERIGRITNDHFTTGNGSTQPNGIVTASTASGTQLAAQTPTYAELVAIQHSVDPAYRGNGSWMFHDSMLAEIKKIVDSSTGRPIWLPNMVGGEPDTILGDPYTINQSMAVAAASGAGKSILYGDLSKYLIRDVREVTLVVADQLYANYHQVAFFAFSRHDGDLLDAGTHPVKHGLNKA